MSRRRCARRYVAVGTSKATRAFAVLDDDDADGTPTRKSVRAVTCASDGAHVVDVDAARVMRTTRCRDVRAARCARALERGAYVVGGDDGGWTADASGTRARWTRKGGGVRDACAVVVRARGRVGEVVVTCGDDGCVVAWMEGEDGVARARGRATLARAAAPLCVDATRAPGVGVGDARHVLAVGCVDGRVRVYACDFTPALEADGEVTFEACGTLDGHADWVRGVAFAPTRSEDAVFLATASQDRNARVWRIQVSADAATEPTRDVAPFMRLAAPPNPPSSILGGRRVKTSLESLLIGHEDWVMSVAWHPDPSNMVLMTASMDRSLMLWTPTGAPSTSEEAGRELWMASTSLGEAAAVCLGYYGASFSPDGDTILANSHGGALHVWRRAANDSWTPIVGISGHTMPVTCLAWDTAGRWLMSGGHDQTTRVHADWRGEGPKGWRQIARPQVHGHDIMCFATMRDLDGDAGTMTYVSGADEKVLRVFEAPGTFLGTLANSLGDADPEGVAALARAQSLSMESLGAELPALGLSNKALRGGSQEDLPSDVAALRAQAAQQEGLMEEYNSRGVEAIVPQSLSTPPLEEVLAQATLWPEVRKLYGHGNEIRAVAAHPGGELIASASNALTSSSAAIWIWSRSENWKPLGSLSGATLTVTALEFTPASADRDLLLAASRDRHVCVFAPCSSVAPRGTFGTEGWRLMTRFKAHDREIFAASWAPCGTVFATAGRDKKIKLWRVVGDQVELDSELPKFAAAPTAVAFATDPDAPKTLAVGFDDGAIEIYVQDSTSSWTLDARATDDERHGACVRAVAWRPGSAVVFASGGDDNAVHVYELE